MPIDYESDIEINPDELDIACLEQANLATRYGRELAKYERAVKYAHEKVKTLKAKLIKDANEFPNELLGKDVKPTATNVEAYYRSDEEYKQAKKNWIEAEYNRDLAKQAYDAITFQRQNSLKILAQLLQMEYYAGPVIPHNIVDRYNEKKARRLQETEEATTAAISPRRKRS